MIVCDKLHGISVCPACAFCENAKCDECQVAVRSQKADFLSRIQRLVCVELMRVARYFMSGSSIACITFATSGDFFG